MGGNKSKPETKMNSKESESSADHVQSDVHSSSTELHSTSFQRTIVTSSTRTRSHSVVTQTQTVLPTLQPASNTLSKFFATGPSKRAPLPISGPFISTYETDAKPFRSPGFSNVFAGPSNNQNLNFSQFSPASPNARTRFGNMPVSERNNDLVIPAALQSHPYTLEETAKAMEIVVKKNGKRYDRGSHVPTYNTSGSKRGMSLIINNVEFKNEEKKRKGATIDEKNLFNLFQRLNLAPKKKTNLTAAEMMKSLKSFANNPKLKTVDMAIVVIMSHGTGAVDKITEISGTDDECIKVSDIIKCFSTQSCPQLKGKPKIFIFQCCRGEQEILEERDAVIANYSCEDMLLAYATLPGFVAIRHTVTGSYYIQAICKVFMEHACDTNILDMLIIVQETLKKYSSSKQTSSYENFSFKCCYLHPS